MERLPSSVCYAHSELAAALEDDGNRPGERLIHDRRYEAAHDWAVARFASDSAQRQIFLCELAMFSRAFRASQAASTYFVDSLRDFDPAEPASRQVLATALAHALAYSDRDFSEKILRLSGTNSGPGSSVAIDASGTEQIRLPIGVPRRLGEDLVAVVLSVHFGDAPSNEATDRLFVQLSEYLDAVVGDTTSTTGLSLLPNISLSVLAALALSAKRKRDIATFDTCRQNMQYCLERFSCPLDAYPVALRQLIAPSSDNRGPKFILKPSTSKPSTWFHSMPSWARPILNWGSRLVRGDN